jgi:predicted nucleic acid-binding protein
MANKIETVTSMTAWAELYEAKRYDALGKAIYATLAAANGTTPEEERAKILKPFEMEVK